MNGRLWQFVVDPSVERVGDLVIGGAPLRIFRLTTVGLRTFTQIARNEPTETSPLTARLVAAGIIHPLAGQSSRDVASHAVTTVTPTLDRMVISSPDRIVVDDGSDPPIPGATIRLDVNGGPAAARNQGLAYVTTEFVALVDADVTAEADWWVPLLGHFDDPNVALVAPRVIPGPYQPSTVLSRYETSRSPLDLGPTPSLVAPGKPVSYVPAAAMLCRTNALRAVGGFDEALRFGEDVDLVWRLNDAGWVCRYDPATTVFHAPRATLGDWVRQRVDYGTSAAPLACRHGDKVAPFRASGWSAVALVVSVLSPPLGVGVAAAAAGLLAHRLAQVPATVTVSRSLVGTWRSAGWAAQAIRRAWWPLLLPGVVLSRRVRLVFGLAAVLSRSAVGCLDDLAYSCGVWRGMVRQRSLRAVVPVLTWGRERSRHG